MGRGISIAALAAGLITLAACHGRAVTPAAEASTASWQPGMIDGAFSPEEASSSAFASASDSTDDWSVSFREKDRVQEAKNMAASHGLATRNANTITVQIDGRLIAGFTDTPTSFWIFRGTLQLAGKTYALVSREDEDGWLHFGTVGPEHGVTWFQNWPQISPDGRSIAYGSREATDVEGFFHVVDWSTPYPHEVYDFTAGCSPQKWLSTTSVQLKCDYPSPNGQAVQSIATRLGAGHWQLKDTKEVIAGTEGKDDFDSLAPVAHSRLKLGIQTAAARHGQPDLTAADPITDEQLRAAGMEWLDHANGP